MAAYCGSFTEVTHAEFARTMLEATVELKGKHVRLSWISPVGKVAAEVANWRIKWLVGVAHLPVAAPWKEMSTIPTGQKVEQMMKLILIQEQSGDFTR